MTFELLQKAGCIVSRVLCPGLHAPTPDYEHKQSCKGITATEPMITVLTVPLAPTESAK